LNELTLTEMQLPETIEDLETYDKYYAARQPTYRKLLRDVKDWEEASEEEKRILKRAQDEADYLIDIRVKLGEITAQIPKASGGDRRSENFKRDTMDTFEKTKQSQLSEIGLTKKQASRYEALAKPENQPIIEQAKARARENNELVTQTEILREIYESKKPHVANNSGDNEWYTPAEYIEAARAVMDVIDLDPASCEYANRTVKASTYYTMEDSGLDKEWFGNVWLNPPYSVTLIKEFADKVASSQFDQAIILVNNATETGWFKTIIDKASAIVFTTGRVHFVKPDGTKGAPLQGQAFIYIGDNPQRFLDVFRQFGWGAML